MVGGPQYRVGSHRHFVLLARALADAGFPVLRFDYHGMGDSDGTADSFEHADGDIGAAIDRLCEEQPQVCQVVLWGLCDGASAALMYSAKDPRVAALALLNPWVRSEVSEARVYLRHYYVRRLINREFWRRVLSGRWGWRESVRDVKALAARASSRTTSQSGDLAPEEDHFIDRMADAWEAFQGRVLLILSGNDLTADEFRDWVAASRRRRAWLRRANTRVETVHEANHTFARRDWRADVTRYTMDWLRSW